MDTIDTDKLHRIQALKQPSHTLRAQGNGSEGKESPEELKQACQNFEEIFLNIILKETKINRSLFEADGASQLYGDMMTESLAKVMAKQGGLGMAEMLYHQLSPEVKKDTTSESSINHPIEVKTSK
ncbi:MAG: rod-binding protein [bacterium]|nr:rod-binding protein [bacterium]